MDVHDKKTRSFNMSKIRAKDTKPEFIVRKFLFSKGFRYKLHDKKLPGHPDIVLKKYKIVVFVNGCFWHGHNNCKYFSIPKTRTDWWKSKIEKNISNDEKNIVELKKLGWKTLCVWECELKTNQREKTLNNLLTKIKPGI
jgi:DNA mismatch endonuclease (patch repair protein)